MAMVQKIPSTPGRSQRRVFCMEHKPANHEAQFGGLGVRWRIVFYYRLVICIKPVGKKHGTGNIHPIINITAKQISFVPEGNGYEWTDPSYDLPAFYEVWALYA